MGKILGIVAAIESFAFKVVGFFLISELGPSQNLDKI